MAENENTTGAAGAAQDAAQHAGAAAQQAQAAQASAQRAADQTSADQPFVDLDAANKEIKRLRDENANRRVNNRTLQEQIDDLKAKVPSADVQAQITKLQGELQRFQAAGQAGISPELLQASQELAAATTPDAMKSAQEKLARLTAPLGGGPRNPTPPTRPTAPPSLDEQIAAAESSKNVREAMRLKTQKLTEKT